ncbi:MAG: hypothetical protein NWF08_01960 [Candidatus Bathyarchaeota archaeon]|nr:hypothetical protein [Candidatus Bathyarchaeota archaeon]
MEFFVIEVINIVLENMPQVYMIWIEMIYIFLVDRDTVSTRLIHLEENHHHLFLTVHRIDAIVVISIDHIDSDDKRLYRLLY